MHCMSLKQMLLQVEMQIILEDADSFEDADYAESFKDADYADSFEDADYFHPVNNVFGMNRKHEHSMRLPEERYPARRE